MESVDVSRTVSGIVRSRRLDRVAATAAHGRDGTRRSRRSRWIASRPRIWPRTSSFWPTTCSKDARPPRAAATWPPATSHRSSSCSALSPEASPRRAGPHRFWREDVLSAGADHREHRGARLHADHARRQERRDVHRAHRFHRLLRLRTAPHRHQRARRLRRLRHRRARIQVERLRRRRREGQSGDGDGQRLRRRPPRSRRSSPARR